MLPVLFLLASSNTVGEKPFAPGIAAIESQARLFPPKRSPWHGKGDSALKVTLWETPAASRPITRKMRVDAIQDGHTASDTYWFQAGKLAYGVQTRAGGVERRLTFAAGHLSSAEERKGSRFYPLVARDVTQLDQNITNLVKTCFAAPGLRSRQATVKAVDIDRVWFNAGPEIDAWVTRRPGDRVPESLIGKKVEYDFTAVEMEGRETDYLNLIRPAGGATTASATKTATAAKKSSVRKKAVKARPRTRRKASS